MYKIMKTARDCIDMRITVGQCAAIAAGVGAGARAHDSRRTATPTSQRLRLDGTRQRLAIGPL